MIVDRNGHKKRIEISSPVTVKLVKGKLVTSTTKPKEKWDSEEV